jgi:hypothetical protein
MEVMGRRTDSVYCLYVVRTSRDRSSSYHGIVRFTVAASPHSTMFTTIKKRARPQPHLRDRSPDGSDSALRDNQDEVDPPYVSVLSAILVIFA